jgi:hypothetical protein
MLWGLAIEYGLALLLTGDTFHFLGGESKELKLFFSN